MARPLRISTLLGAVLSLCVLFACSGPTDPGQSNVRVVLGATGGAAPAPALAVAATARDDDDDDHARDGGYLSRLEAAGVTFSSLLARNSDGQLVDLGLDLPTTVDVMGLLEGNQITLPAGSLPPGDYDQLVVVMTELELAFLDGGKIAVTPPGGGWTSIVPVAPFTVVEGEDLTIELNLRLRRAFRLADGAFGFFPEFDGWHD